MNPAKVVVGEIEELTLRLTRLAQLLTFPAQRAYNHEKTGSSADVK